MLKSYNEEYFSMVKDTTDDGRLSPGRISVFLIATLIFSAAMIATSLNAAIYGDNTDSIWAVFLLLDIFVWIIHLILGLFYFNEKIAYKLQKFQSHLLCFFTLRFSLEAYLVYFFICEDSNAPSFMTTLGLLMMLGGIIFLLFSTLRAIRRVKQGHFQKGGRGLYDFNQSKGYVSLPIIYAGTVLAGFIPRVFADNNAYLSVGPFIALFLSVFLQYIMAMVLPEFFLLAYSKTRFDSFHVKPLQRGKSKRRRK